jgi:hypothetical protein
MEHAESAFNIEDELSPASHGVPSSGGIAPGHSPERSWSDTGRAESQMLERGDWHEEWRKHRTRIMQSSNADFSPSPPWRVCPEFGTRTGFRACSGNRRWLGNGPGWASFAMLKSWRKGYEWVEMHDAVGGGYMLAISRTGGSRMLKRWMDREHQDRTVESQSGSGSINLASWSSTETSLDTIDHVVLSHFAWCNYRVCLGGS